MAILINDNYSVNVGKPIDSKYLDGQTPWASTGATNIGIPISYRYTGLTVNILGAEYWYANGITDPDLVLKTNIGTLTGATSGLHLTGGGTQVALGGILTGNTIFGTGSGNTFTLKYNASLPTFTDESLVTKKYADMVAVGVHPKEAVEVATTGVITLSGLTAIDGVTAITGMRILVKNQVSQWQNGIYSASTGIWGRTSDFNFAPSGETVQGDLIPVISGSTHKNTLWVLVSENPVVSGNSIIFTLFSSPSFVAGVGINIAGSTISIKDLAGDSLIWNIGLEKLNVDTTSGSLATALGNKLNISDFNTYTGATQPILNAAITGATNGLGIFGRNVCLGGCLNANTLVDSCGNNLTISNINEFQVSTTGLCTTFGFDKTGFLLSFSGGSASFEDTGGIKYGADYCANYTNRSLVDKEYVDKKITGSTTYNCASPSAVCVGGMLPNTVLTGRTLSNILEEILVPELCGTLTAPSVSMSLSPTTTTYEVGTQISTTITGSFNRGCINPQYYSACDKRSCGALCYCFCGCQIAGLYSCNALSMSKSLTAYNVCSGGQIWYVQTCYSAGVQPKSNKNNNFSSPLPAGFTAQAYCTITGIYPWFWGSSVSAPTINQTLIDNLTCKCVASSSASITVDNFNVTGKYIWFAIPCASASKTCWQGANNPSNNGVIPGGLFPSACCISINSPACDSPSCWTGQCYKIYVSNYATNINYGMTFCN